MDVFWDFRRNFKKVLEIKVNLMWSDYINRFELILSIFLCILKLGFYWTFLVFLLYLL